MKDLSYILNIAAQFNLNGHPVEESIVIRNKSSFPG